ncbi:cytochrome b-c1 complex subunit 8 [Frankliniella occidentalis]|uniref:Cytochrome b-c1 complex subunit 8 n=1 Tax=Frankliniella occidentalis TaxID=133901 RepID=A0A6J1S7P2_FRAOC|nr:cytochrome b-c1 complex subunit 8 [Frankliniella occidentalis]
MKLSPLMNAAKWGELAKFRNIATFRLSPYELKPFAGFISHGVPNTIRRIRGQFFRVAPPFIAGYLVYDWANAENERLSRKNPKDFENDV